MKPIRQQFVDALGYKGKSFAHYLDFTLIVIAGFAVLFGEISGMEAYSGRDAFDSKVAIGCFALAGVCVLLARNRILALSCSILIPASLVGTHALFSKDRAALVFYFASIAIGLLVIVIGALIKSFWTRSSSRSK
jgi:hypothetical protein